MSQGTPHVTLQVESKVDTSLVGMPLGVECRCSLSHRSARRYKRRRRRFSYTSQLQLCLSCNPFLDFFALPLFPPSTTGSVICTVLKTLLVSVHLI